MPRFRCLLLTLAGLLLAAAPVAAQPAQTRAEPVTVPNFWDPRARLERPSAPMIGAIRFLTVDDFPPFSFRDRRGVLIGFDVDLARAICATLEVQCAIQTRPFDTLEAALADNTGNAIIAGLDPEDAEAAGLLASQAYLKIPGRFAARNDTPFDPERPPPDRFVGVACGSAHQAFIARLFPALRVACYENEAAALAGLKEGRLAAVFGDALGLSFWLHGAEADGCCGFVGGPYLDDRYFGAGLAVVMRADDRDLKAAIDYALREIYRAGTYEELYLRYFPVSLF